MRQLSTTFIAIIATLAIGIVLFLLIYGFQIFTSSAALGACVGELEGVRCDNNGCPASVGSEVIIGIDHELLCSNFIERTDCLFTYGNISFGDEQTIAVCEFFENGILDRRDPTGNTKIYCLLNPALSCSHFAGSVSPTCEQALRCQPKSAPEILVDRAFGRFFR